MQRAFDVVRRSRRRAGDAYNYNWLLKIPREFQLPFEVSHASMASLALSMDQPAHERAGKPASRLSGIVAGNVKGGHPPDRAEAVRDPCRAADRKPLDELLRGFVAERRMKLVGNIAQLSNRLIALGARERPATCDAVPVLTGSPRVTCGA
jgi:hypothetical protein